MTILKYFLLSKMYKEAIKAALESYYQSMKKQNELPEENTDC